MNPSRRARREQNITQTRSDAKHARPCLDALNRLASQRFAVLGKLVAEVRTEGKALRFEPWSFEAMVASQVIQAMSAWSDRVETAAPAERRAAAIFPGDPVRRPRTAIARSRDTTA
jgi:hypothetical protein